LVDVQEYIVLPLEEGWLLLNEGLDEFSQQEDDLAVPVADVDHLL